MSQSRRAAHGRATERKGGGRVPDRVRRQPHPDRGGTDREPQRRSRTSLSPSSPISIGDVGRHLERRRRPRREALEALGMAGREGGEEGRRSSLLAEHEGDDTQPARVQAGPAPSPPAVVAVGVVGDLDHVRAAMLHAVGSGEPQVERLGVRDRAPAGGSTASCPPSRPGTPGSARSPRTGRATRCSRTRGRSRRRGSSCVPRPPRRRPARRPRRRGPAPDPAPGGSASRPGRRPSGGPSSAATVPTIACEPSPPAMPRTSAPLAGHVAHPLEPVLAWLEHDRLDPAPVAFVRRGGTARPCRRPTSGS